MPEVTLATVLKQVVKLEQMLSEHCRDLSERTDDERVRLLANYLRRHHRRIWAVLEKMPPERSRRILEATLRYPPEVTELSDFEKGSFPTDVTREELLDATIRFDECIVKLYRQARRDVLDPDARQLMETLVAYEEGDAVELAKLKATDYY